MLIKWIRVVFYGYNIHVIHFYHTAKAQTSENMFIYIRLSRRGWVGGGSFNIFVFFVKVREWANFECVTIRVFPAHAPEGRKSTILNVIIPAQWYYSCFVAAWAVTDFPRRARDRHSPDQPPEWIQLATGWRRGGGPERGNYRRYWVMHIPGGLHAMARYCFITSRGCGCFSVTGHERHIRWTHPAAQCTLLVAAATQQHHSQAIQADNMKNLTALRIAINLAGCVAFYFFLSFFHGSLLLVDQ